MTGDGDHEENDWLNGRDGTIFQESMLQIVSFPKDLETFRRKWTLLTTAYSLQIDADCRNATWERDFSESKLDSWRRLAETVLTGQGTITLDRLYDELHPTAMSYSSMNVADLMEPSSENLDDLDVLKSFASMWTCFQNFSSG
jgi:hypothetical protein